MRSDGGAPGAIVISGQSLVEVWPGSSAIGFCRSHQCRGCRVNASTSIFVGMFADPLNQRVEIGRRGGGCEIPLPERHVEGRMLAAHEACDTDAVFAFLTASGNSSSGRRSASQAMIMQG